jgi:hypothetical protein
MQKRRQHGSGASRRTDSERSRHRYAAIIRRVQDYGFAFAPRVAPHLDTAQFAALLGTSEILDGLDPVQSLTPKPIEATTPNVYSGQFGLGPFPFHTDLAHWSLPPRFVLLCCRRGDARVFTGVLPWSRVLRHLPSDAERRARFRPRRALHGRVHLLPFRQRVGDRTLWRWDSVFLEADNPDAAAIANSLTELDMTSVAERVVLRDPGDVLVIDNWRTLHSRGAVPAEGSDRMVERAYLREIGING